MPDRRDAPGIRRPLLGMRRRGRSTGGAAIACLLWLVGSTPADAQDVEMRGRVHGTRPPDAYYEQMRRDADAFRFGREGGERLDALRQGMAARSARLFRGPALQGIGPRDNPLVGALPLPLVLGTLSDGSPPAYTGDEVDREFFTGPNSYFQTIPEYYDEVSGGLLELVGTTFDWTDTGLTKAQVAQGVSGLQAHPTLGVGGYIESILEALEDQGTDWSPFDTDGDGVVDVLTVIHPGRGAECTGSPNEIWSHRWTLESVTNRRLVGGFETSTPRPGGGGNIRIDDYIIQPLLACDAESISEIGTFAHELGHAFGLPDLYRTSSIGQYWGSGNWDLMGTGGYGCNGGTPERPCHLGAWSKAALGWVTVDEVGPDAEVALLIDPVETARRVVKLSARDGSNEYVLLENRQRIGSDVTLPEPGLLIWHVNDAVLGTAWRSNSVNNNPNLPGIWLRQADGRNDLFRVLGGRGDRGDPFPGCIKDSLQDYGNPLVPCEENRAFHAGTSPGATSALGSGLGVTLTDIRRVGSEPFQIALDASTRISTIQLLAERDGVPVNVPGFVVDGEVQPGTPVQFSSAPYESHVFSAAGGIPTGPGERISFLEWTDGGERTRELEGGFTDETFTARYRDEEIRLLVTTNDPVDGVSPATFVAEPGEKVPEGGDEFWYPEGTAVSVLATPRTGFRFLDWVGAANSTDNPIVVSLDQPEQLQANFDVTYALVAVPGALDVEVATPQEIVFQVDEANAPVTWSVAGGSLPPGLLLGAGDGVISGAAIVTGVFEASIAARDAIGLEAQATVTFDVGPPSLGTIQMASSFVSPIDQVSALQKVYFDSVGNADGSYDIGDFRAYLLANPGLPESAPPAAPGPRRSSVVLPSPGSRVGEEGGG